MRATTPEATRALLCTTKVTDYFSYRARDFCSSIFQFQVKFFKLQKQQEGGVLSCDFRAAPGGGRWMNIRHDVFDTGSPGGGNLSQITTPLRDVQCQQNGLFSCF